MGINFISGYVFILGGGVIFLKLFRQCCTVKLILEFEVIIFELVGQEVK